MVPGAEPKSGVVADLAASEARRLHAELAAHARWFVLTGAGCSTASGIPAYRDELGHWKHDPPIHFSTFTSKPEARRRYWARSFYGYPRLQKAQPNAAHQALAELERAGRVEALVTQNVDGLHQRAGSRSVVELHGSIHWVACLRCGQRYSRAAVQQQLAQLNPAAAAGDMGPRTHAIEPRPDGDAHRGTEEPADFAFPECERCAGTLKPAVTFFGEGVPRPWVEQAYAALARAEAMLVVGTSLSLLSGYRFVKRARDIGLRIVVVNRGATRADAAAAAIFDADCEVLLSAALGALLRDAQA